MYELLKGLRVIEVSAFIAAPYAGLSLAQMGVDVIRIDPIGGGLDYRRWPVTEEGRSLYGCAPRLPQPRPSGSPSKIQNPKS